MILEWAITNYGAELHIDDYDNLPTESIGVVDIETNGKEVTEDGFRIICIGICTSNRSVYVYFDIRPALLDYLRRLQIIAHAGKNAEIAWLKQYGVTIEQLYFDTKTGYYVYDSAKKNYSLKPIVKEIFQVEYPTYDEIISNKEWNGGKKKATLEDIPKEIVAAYNACDCLWTYRLWVWLRQQFTQAQVNFFETIEMPMTRLIYKMENEGVKIDTKIVRRIHNENSKARRIAKRDVLKSAGCEFNLNSPKQLLPILQNHGLGIEGTGIDQLVPYRGNPLVQQLLTYRKHQKICSTYTIPLYVAATKNNTSRIHAHFSQNTITGRLSSSDPVNLQNQPAEIREAFVAEEGYSFINADWSNIELRLPAHFSQEPGFVEELSKHDGDLHTHTANFIYQCDIRSLTEEEFKKKRKVAKTCNFLLTNSGTAHQLSKELECSFDEAKEIYRMYWAGYPRMATWLKNEKLKARIHGGVTTWFGRWVAIPQLRLFCADQKLCGSKFWKGRRCKNCQIREEAERSAMSVLVQGTAADMCKLAALRLYREYGYVPNLAVHDELNYEIKDSDLQIAKARIKKVMESVVSLRVPLVAELKIAKNWKECK
jgi:DNA polymerase I